MWERSGADKFSNISKCYKQGARAKGPKAQDKTLALARFIYMVCVYMMYA